MSIKSFKALGISNEMIDIEPQIKTLISNDVEELVNDAIPISLNAFDVKNSNRTLILWGSANQVTTGNWAVWDGGGSNHLNSVWGTITYNTTNKTLTFSQPGRWEWNLTSYSNTQTSTIIWGVRQGGVIFNDNKASTTASLPYPVWASSNIKNCSSSGEFIITQNNTNLYINVKVEEAFFTSITFKALNPVSNPTNIENPS